MPTPSALHPARPPTYTRLPDAFYARVSPEPPPAPELLQLNLELARELGLDPDRLGSPEGAEILAGSRAPEASAPIALAYAGHQFGNFVPLLGDGRAAIVGEARGSDGAPRDIQLKGSGRTPYARRGDGRAPLGAVVREYLAGEAMAGLGIPTTRALAMVATGGEVYRPAPEPGGVLARVARSHLRVGTFEYAARLGEDAVRALADFALARHAPERLEAANPYAALLELVAERTADLVASWMLVGFVHGVMNTDNLSIAGETIDYGPFAFLDRYHPRSVFSSIDTGGRYAYDQQPRVAQWNLARLAEALLPLLGPGEDDAVAAAEAALGSFADRFGARYTAGLRRKLGLGEERPGDGELGDELLSEMARAGADYTLAFRRLSELGAEPDDRDARFLDLFTADASGAEAWLATWRARLAEEAAGEDADGDRRARMRAENPAYVLRHYQAERAARAAAEGDLGPVRDLLAVFADPFADHPGYEAYGAPPTPEEAMIRTFCGT